jgi:hypothetical protein
MLSKPGFPAVIGYGQCRRGACVSLGSVCLLFLPLRRFDSADTTMVFLPRKKRLITPDMGCSSLVEDVIIPCLSIFYGNREAIVGVSPFVTTRRPYY